MFAAILLLVRATGVMGDPEAVLRSGVGDVSQASLLFRHVRIADECMVSGRGTRGCTPLPCGPFGVSTGVSGDRAMTAGGGKLMGPIS